MESVMESVDARRASGVFRFDFRFTRNEVNHDSMAWVTNT